MERAIVSVQEVGPKKGKTKTIFSHPDKHSGVPFKNYLPHFHSSSQTPDHRNTVFISRLLRNSCRNGEADINLCAYACVCVSIKKKIWQNPQNLLRSSDLFFFFLRQVLGHLSRCLSPSSELCYCRNLMGKSQASNRCQNAPINLQVSLVICFPMLYIMIKSCQVQILVQLFIKQ